MKTKKSKDNGSKAQGMDIGLCNQANFQRMFEKMGQCCRDQDNVMGCSPMPDGMMKNMMDRFCQPDTNDTKGNASQQVNDEE